VVTEIQNAHQKTGTHFAGGFSDFAVEFFRFFDNQYTQRWILAFEQECSGRAGNSPADDYNVMRTLHAKQNSV
jgi:hypothetical protein